MVVHTCPSIPTLCTCLWHSFFWTVLSITFLWTELKTSVHCPTVFCSPVVVLWLTLCLLPIPSSSVHCRSVVQLLQAGDPLPGMTRTVWRSVLRYLWDQKRFRFEPFYSLEYLHGLYCLNKLNFEIRNLKCSNSWTCSIPNCHITCAQDLGCHTNTGRSFRVAAFWIGGLNRSDHDVCPSQGTW